MKRIFALLLAVTSISMLFVACDKFDASRPSYQSHLLSLPEGITEKGNNVYYKKSADIIGFGTTISVWSFNLKQDIVVEAANDTVFETEEIAKKFYDTLTLVGGDNEEEGGYQLNGRIIPQDVTPVFKGVSHDELLPMLETISYPNALN